MEYVNGIPISTGVGYQPSGMLAGYRTGVYRPPGTFGQNVATTIGQDSVSGRLTSIAAAGGSSSFSTGSYAYDGGGNITGMGLDLFSYDNRSRLTQAYLAGVGSTNCQHFDYDSYGNLWQYQSGSWSSGACSATSTTSLCATGACANNRLDAGVATYDNGSPNGRGNLTTNVLFGGEQFTYDGLNRVLMNQSGPTTTNYVYDGSSERIARVQSGNWTYTLRDGQGRLTTEITGSSPSLDNVFLGNQLVASYAPGNTSVWAFYTADHLGTPRLITDLAANTVETRRHWPFGGDVGTPGPLEKLRFAGMERDLEGNHYYDHARSHDSNLGRFLTPDPLQGGYGPQSWNRYAYTLGNPLRFVDPFGLSTIVCHYESRGEGEPANILTCQVVPTIGGGGTPGVPGSGENGGGQTGTSKKEPPKKEGCLGQRLSSAAKGVANLAVGTVKLVGMGAAAASTPTTGPLGAVAAGYLGIQAAGNIAAGNVQLIGAITGQIRDTSQGATLATTATTAAGLGALFATGGDLNKSAGWATAESLGTSALSAGATGSVFDKSASWFQKAVLSTELGQNMADAMGLNSDGTCK